MWQGMYELIVRGSKLINVHLPFPHIFWDGLLFHHMINPSPAIPMAMLKISRIPRGCMRPAA
jgi:hypothetical protein